MSRQLLTQPPRQATVSLSLDVRHSKPRTTSAPEIARHTDSQHQQMSGTLQLLFYSGLAGLGLGAGWKSFHELSWFRLAPAGVAWLVFVFSLADAFWNPLSPRGRDWIDRVGIFIRGIGFGFISLAFLLQSRASSVLLIGAGALVTTFGRIFWELLVCRHRETMH